MEVPILDFIILTITRYMDGKRIFLAGMSSDNEAAMVKAVVRTLNNCEQVIKNLLFRSISHLAELGAKSLLPTFHVSCNRGRSERQ